MYTESETRSKINLTHQNNKTQFVKYRRSRNGRVLYVRRK